MELPQLTVISFGSQRKELHQRSIAALKERFGAVEWLDSADANPAGDWVWCLPGQCTLPLGALLRAEGILEENVPDIHLFGVEVQLRDGAVPLEPLQKLSNRISILRPSSILLKSENWRSLFANRHFFEIAEMGLSGVETEIRSRGYEVLSHPENVQSEEAPLTLDWKRLYLRQYDAIKKLASLGSQATH